MNGWKIALLVAACICFFAALILTAGIVHGSNPTAWEDGGFLALALSCLLPAP